MSDKFVVKAPNEKEITFNTADGKKTYQHGEVIEGSDKYTKIFPAFFRKVEEAVVGLVADAKEAVEEIVEKVEEQIEEIKEEAVEAVETAQEVVETVVEEVKEAAAEIKEEVEKVVEKKTAKKAGKK